MTAVRGVGVRDGMKNVEGLSKEKKKQLIDNSMVVTRGKGGWGRLKREKG